MQILPDFLSNHVCSCSHDGGTPTFGPTTSTSASYSSLMRRARQESAALRSSFTSHHTAFTWPHPEVSCNMMQRVKERKPESPRCRRMWSSRQRRLSKLCSFVAKPTASYSTGCHSLSPSLSSCSNKEGDSNQFNMNRTYVYWQVIAELPHTFLFEVQLAPTWYYHTDSTQTHKRTVLLILSLKQTEATWSNWFSWSRVVMALHEMLVLDSSRNIMNYLST